MHHTLEKTLGKPARDRIRLISREIAGAPESADLACNVERNRDLLTLP